MWLKPACFTVIAAISIVMAGCSYPKIVTNGLSSDASLSIPKDWKLVEEPKWGIRFKVPASLQMKGVENGSLWTHENDDLRVIVNFGRNPDLTKLSQKKNYKQEDVSVNGLKALLCTYEEEKPKFNRVAILIFIDKRKELGSPNEPSYRVEFSFESDQKTAVRILQTVRFYNS